MAKRPESAFPLWRRGIPRLGRALNALKRLESLVPAEDVAAQLALVDSGLRVNREIRETLLAEMRVRREIVELRKLELDGMHEDEVEALLVRTAQRRGFRHIDGIREGLVGFFQALLGYEGAKRLVDRALPRPDNIRSKRQRLDRGIGVTYDAIQRELEEGAAEVREALEGGEPVPSSEATQDPQPGGEATGSDGSVSDDGGRPPGPSEA